MERSEAAREPEHRVLAHRVGAGQLIAVFGSLLLVVSDLIARTIIAPAQLPVGVVTLCLGGAYLVWLLATSGKRVRR